MSYMPLSDILSALDARQREELAALAGLVDAAELQRVREAKKRLFAASVFFIERSWEVLAPQVEAFSLESEAGKSGEELRAYLEILRNQQPAFAWGWIRARMESCLMRRLENCVPGLLRQCPEQAASYADSLGSLYPYWFRQTPLLHLKAGYHTALAVACKWYGSMFELLPNTSASCPYATRGLSEELRRFASFSMTMLVRTDSYLWDSAGAESLEAALEGGTLKVVHKAVEEARLDSAPDYGLRLGCPALRARNQAGQPAFPGIVAWVEQVFSRHLLEPEVNPASRAL